MTLIEYLQELAVTCGGDDVHGAEYDSEIFMLHPHCWCERADCPWCGGCECPPEADKYYFDGVEITLDEFEHLFEFATKDTIVGSGAWKRAANKINYRRKTVHVAMSDFCAGTGIFGEHGSIPGRRAPNFWHKPSGLRVWWHKVIADIEFVSGDADDLESVFADCAASIAENGSVI